MQRYIIISLIWCTLPFLVLVLGLGYFQLPVADDLIYQKAFEENGIWSGVELLRSEWNTRWASMLSLGVLFKLVPTRWLGLVFQSVTLLSSAFILFSFIRRYGSVKAGNALVAAIYLVAILFLATFGKADSWFWLCSTATYIWPGIAAIFLITILYTKRNWFKIIPVLLFSILVGGGSEIVAISYLTVLVSIKVFENRFPKHNQVFWTLTFVITTVALVFGLFGEGAQVRLEALPDNALGPKLLIGFKGYVSMLFIGLPKKLAVVLVASLSLSFILRMKAPRPSTTVLLGIADTVLMVTFILLGLIMSEMGPKRSWFHISIMLVVISVFLSMKFRPRGSWKKVVLNLTLIGNGMMGIYFWNLVKTEIPKAAEYHWALEQRTKKIHQKLAQGQRIIELTPLPEPGILYWAEITTDPTAPENQQLSLIYGEDVQFALSRMAAESE